MYRRNGILKGEVLKRVAINLLSQNKSEAIKIIQEDYPFVHLEREKRTYSDKQKILRPKSN